MSSATIDPINDVQVFANFARGQLTSQLISLICADSIARVIRDDVRDLIFETKSNAIENDLGALLHMLNLLVNEVNAAKETNKLTVFRVLELLKKAEKEWED